MSEQIKLGLLENCISIEECNKFTISEWLTRGPSYLVQQCMEWKESSSVAADCMDVDGRSHEGSVITEEDSVIYLFIYYFPTIKITQALHYTKMWRGDLRKPQGLYEEAPSLQ